MIEGVSALIWPLYSKQKAYTKDLTALVSHLEEVLSQFSPDKNIGVYSSVVPDTNLPIYFKPASVDLGSERDCDRGFKAFGGISRDELVRILLPLASDKDARRFLWREIYDAFETNAFKRTPEFEDICEKSQKGEIKEPDDFFREYCTRENIFRAYIEAYSGNLGLGWRSIFLYAVEAGIKLYGWKHFSRGGKNVLDLDPDRIAIPKKTAHDTQVIHLLLTSSHVHFERLEVVEKPTKVKFFQLKSEVNSPDDLSIEYRPSIYFELVEKIKRLESGFTRSFFKRKLLEDFLANFKAKIEIKNGVIFLKNPQNADTYDKNGDLTVEALRNMKDLEHLFSLNGYMLPGYNSTVNRSTYQGFFDDVQVKIKKEGDLSSHQGKRYLFLEKCLLDLSTATQGYLKILCCVFEIIKIVHVELKCAWISNFSLGEPEEGIVEKILTWYSRDEIFREFDSKKILQPGGKDEKESKATVNALNKFVRYDNILCLTIESRLLECETSVEKFERLKKLNSGDEKIVEVCDQLIAFTLGFKQFMNMLIDNNGAYKSAFSSGKDLLEEIQTQSRKTSLSPRHEKRATGELSPPTRRVAETIKKSDVQDLSAGNVKEAPNDDSNIKLSCKYYRYNRSVDASDLLTISGVYSVHSTQQLNVSLSRTRDQVSKIRPHYVLPSPRGVANNPELSRKPLESRHHSTLHLGLSSPLSIVKPSSESSSVPSGKHNLPEAQLPVSPMRQGRNPRSPQKAKFTQLPKSPDRSVVTKEERLLASLSPRLSSVSRSNSSPGKSLTNHSTLMRSTPLAEKLKGVEEIHGDGQQIKDGRILSDMSERKTQPRAVYEQLFDAIQDGWDKSEMQKAIDDSLLENENLEHLRAVLLSQAASFGFTVKEIERDGNCFFHAVLDQLQQIEYPNSENFTAEYLRHCVIQHINDYLYLYKDFVENMDVFIAKMAQRGEWADHNIIQALARVLNVTIVLIRSDAQEPNASRRKNSVGILYLGYEVGLHFQSLIITRGTKPEKDIKDYIERVEIDNFDNPITLPPILSPRLEGVPNGSHLEKMGIFSSPTQHRSQQSIFKEGLRARFDKKSGTDVCVSDTAKTLTTYDLTEQKSELREVDGKTSRANNLLCQAGYFLLRARDFLANNDLDSVCMALMSAGTCARNFKKIGLNEESESVMHFLNATSNKLCSTLGEDVDLKKLSELLGGVTFDDLVKKLEKESKDMGYRINVLTYYQDRIDKAYPQAPTTSKTSPFLGKK